MSAQNTAPTPVEVYKNIALNVAYIRRFHFAWRTRRYTLGMVEHIPGLNLRFMELIY